MLSVIYTERHLNVIYAECRKKPFMLSVIMLYVIMLSVIMMSVIMLSVSMLSVSMLNVIMLNVVAPILNMVVTLAIRHVFITNGHA